MPRRPPVTVTLVLAAFLVVGSVIPAAGAIAGSGGLLVGTQDSASANQTANNSTVDVAVGQQLSTVVAVTSNEVQTDYENTAFDAESEGELAEAVADRAAELRENAREIREDYREATEAYRAGDLTKEEYAQRLALLNDRASNLRRSYEIVQSYAANLSAEALRRVEMNRTALREAVRSLENVTGTGPAALRALFTGDATGEIEFETDNGFSIAVESEDGKRAIEIDRPRGDRNSAVTINESAALREARAAIRIAANETWTVTERSVDEDEGYYEFEFVLESQTHEGETEVRVDGSSGVVFHLEQEVEPRDGDTGSTDETLGESALSLDVVAGEPAPGATITVRVLDADGPASNATVFLDGERVGMVDRNGTITVTLPNEDVRLTAAQGEAEVERDFEFADRETTLTDEALNLTASATDGTVTVSVSVHGDPVADATIYANDERVGTTGANGTVTFALDASDEVDITAVKGDADTEVTFTVVDGSLVRERDG